MGGSVKGAEGHDPGRCLGAGVGATVRAVTGTAAPIRFQAKLLRPASPKGAAWSFLLLPAGASARLPTRSMVATTTAGNLPCRRR